IQAAGARHGLQSLQAAPARLVEPAEAAKAVGEVGARSGRGVGTGQPLELDGFFEAPESLRGRAEVEVRPPQSHPGPAMARIDFQGALEEWTRLGRMTRELKSAPAEVEREGI